MFIHKIKEYVAYHAILSILPVNFAVNYIKGHQDDFKLSKDLTIEEQLNIDTEKIATTCAKISLNIHLSFSSLAIYIKENIYTFPRTKEFDNLASQMMQKTFYKPNITRTLLPFKISNGNYIQYNSINSHIRKTQRH